MNGRTLAVKNALGAVALLGLVAIILRLWFGLGATTALSDAVPWGLWKILNMIAGVALATGGFTLACIVYVLGLEKYRPLVRPAILVAFLGYGASCFALFLDIGLPHRIWHPMVYWNHHSFLFEVALCVMFYFSVTVFEMAPVILEKSPFSKLAHALHRITPPVVIVGITLSTLHHSSLGSLFLISPSRLHELWYTPWLPALFFVSAVGAGMMSLVLVTQAYGWLKRREPKQELLRGIAIAAAVALGLLLVMNLADITRRGVWPAVFSGSFESWLYMASVLLSSVIPCILIAVPKIRNTTTGLVTASSSAVAGLVLGRLNVGIFGYLESAGVSYVPTFSEWALSLGILAGAGLVFIHVSEYFSIFDLALAPEPANAAAVPFHGKGPQPLWQNLSRYRLRHATLLPVIAIPLWTLFLWGSVVHGYPLRNTPVVPPKAMDAERATLRIDGDADGEHVLFDHARHQDDLGGSASCQKCHHAFLPGDPQTPCHRCHTDMSREKSVFNHDHHALRVGQRIAAGLDTELGAEPVLPPTGAHVGMSLARLQNLSCGECHDEGAPKSEHSAQDCTECHGEDMGLCGEEATSFDKWAPGYVGALHGLCIECHKEEGPARGHENLGECQTCHEGRKLGPTADLS